MILMIIFGVLLIAAIVGVILFSNTLWHLNCAEDMFGFCAAILIIVALLILIFGSVAIVKNIREDVVIYETQLERDAIVDTYNQYSQEYNNDIIHSNDYKSIREDISNFNSEIYGQNKWKKNAWIGWYYYDFSSIKPIEIVDGVAR